MKTAAIARLRLPIVRSAPSPHDIETRIGDRRITGNQRQIEASRSSADQSVERVFVGPHLIGEEDLLGRQVERLVCGSEVRGRSKDSAKSARMASSAPSRLGSSG